VAELATQVIEDILSAIANDVELQELARVVVDPYERNDRRPGDVLLGLAAESLELGGVDRDHRLELAGIRERYLVERPFSGNADHQRSNSALRLAGLLHAGFDVDLDEEVGWWRSDDFPIYALYALVIFLRAASARTGRPVGELCGELAGRHNVELRFA
jgi:hypothetical protein